jgi:hypothetical protein
MVSAVYYKTLSGRLPNQTGVAIPDVAEGKQTSICTPTVKAVTGKKNSRTIFYSASSIPIIKIAKAVTV